METNPDKLNDENINNLSPNSSELDMVEVIYHFHVYRQS